MCQQFSWIIKDKKVVFLTAKDVFHSKRGRELRKHTTYTEDWHGHGAIRWFYSFVGGKDYECTDFSTPDNFPASMVKAIKLGHMWEFGITQDMHVMLKQPALAEYTKIKQQAWAEYEKIERQAWAEYEKIKQPAWAEYTKIKQQAWAECTKIKQPAWVEYTKIEQQALAEYTKIEQAAWAEAWSDTKNRIASWR